jgi:hypothetical protein
MLTQWMLKRWINARIPIFDRQQEVEQKIRDGNDQFLTDNKRQSKKTETAMTNKLEIIAEHKTII